MTDMLAAALGYAVAGWPVFPCTGAKRPLTDNGFHDASTDPAVIRAWWSRWSLANIGVPTGPRTVDVLDVDVRREGNGWGALTRLASAGLLAGAVRLVRTPSGGLHVYFPGTTQRATTLPGRYIDFKADGGYVLVPPSYVVCRDKGYQGPYVEVERREGGRPLDWAAVRRLLDPPRLVVPVRRSSGAPQGLDALVRFVAGLREGNRNAGLFWAACRAVEQGHGDLSQLVAAAVSAGLPADEAERTVRSAARRVEAVVSS